VEQGVPGILRKVDPTWHLVAEMDHEGPGIFEVKLRVPIRLSISSSIFVFDVACKLVCKVVCKAVILRFTGVSSIVFSSTGD
jgi:hypothetical protein